MSTTIKRPTDPFMKVFVGMIRSLAKDPDEESLRVSFSFTWSALNSNVQFTGLNRLGLTPGQREAWAIGNNLPEVTFLRLYLNSVADILEELITPQERAIRSQITSQDSLEKPLSDYEFSIRTNGCLKSEGIQTLGQLIVISESNLLRIPNFGRKSLNEIREALAASGLRLGMTEKEAIDVLAKS